MENLDTNKQQYYDVMNSEIPEFKVLDDGFVRLVDMMPRMVPIGRKADFAVIRNARVSTGQGLKSVEEDKKLLRYLYVNQHSTPFESIVFTFHLRLPRFVATHFHRHRTASINEFSQRYAAVDEDSFFHPSLVVGSLRKQSKMNQQASEEEVTDPEVRKLVEAMEAKVSSLFQDYKVLLAAGIGKEVARSFLPVSTYTEMYYTMNLRNLLHFLELRYDAHTQKETRDYAEAMYKIVAHVVPETIELFEDVTRQGMHLSKREVDVLASNIDALMNEASGSRMHFQQLEGASISEKKAFQNKETRLGF